MDIFEDIERTLDGVKRGGGVLERGLAELRAEWEREVNELIADTKTDVDLAVRDVEDAIQVQREEWRRLGQLFEARWRQQGDAGAAGAAAGEEGGLPQFEGPLLQQAALLAELPAEFERERRMQAVLLRERIEKISLSVAKTQQTVETDLNDFKRKWATTAERIDALPEELPNLRSLADIRAYVADTIFAGDVPALLPRATPLGPAAGGVQIGAADSAAVLRPTTASNLRQQGRLLTIVTTAALPWMTGTSINPLLRAAHLSAKEYNVTLMLPWLSPAEQPTLFPQGLVFDRPAQQEAYARWWLRNRANLEAPRLRFLWYPAQYEPFLGCIIQRAGVDLTTLVPPAERDVVVLEEPEHINWYHHGRRWTAQFEHVVGVAHTNYLQYARLNNLGAVPGEIKEQWTKVMNDVVVAAYTDVVIRLSPTLAVAPGHDLVCNVHGVRAEFLAIGAGAAEAARSGESAFTQGAYFLGKALWTKGYRELFENLQAHADSGKLPLLYAGGAAGAAVGAGAVGAGAEGAGAVGAGAVGAGAMGAGAVGGGAVGGGAVGGGAPRFARAAVGGGSIGAIHTYGSGPDGGEIRAAAASLPVVVHDGIDHAHPTLHGYSVFVNPSTSDVLCTATAEALAMGKKVLIPRHPSNVFFEQFANAIMYDETEQLVPKLAEALSSPPAPLNEMEQYMLSWEAATERLLDAAALPAGTKRPKERPLHQLAYYAHWTMGVQPVFDVFRSVTGATPVMTLPQRLGLEPKPELVDSVPTTPQALPPAAGTAVGVMQQAAKLPQLQAQLPQQAAQAQLPQQAAQAQLPQQTHQAELSEPVQQALPQPTHGEAAQRVAAQRVGFRASIGRRLGGRLRRARQEATRE